MTAAEIRRATSQDVDAIARVWHAGWIDGHLGHVPEALVRQRTPETFWPRAAERVGCTWVAVQGGRIAGFIVLVADELEQIYVDGAARGTGLGKVLLRRAEAEIRAAGFAGAWLAVATGNQRARDFYARSGWRDAGPISYMAETDAGPLAVPCHRYERDLSLSA
jgi:ribosomal protein S18 acetylase RimI-like enzyme